MKQITRRLQGKYTKREKDIIKKKYPALAKLLKR